MCIIDSMHLHSAVFGANGLGTPIFSLPALKGTKVFLPNTSLSQHIFVNVYRPKAGSWFTSLALL